MKLLETFKIQMPTDNQRVKREYKVRINASKFNNLNKMNKFLERYKLTKLTQEEKVSLNRLIFMKNIEFIT